MKCLYIRGKDIHTKVVDQCFTDEQKAVLTYTQGKVVMDVLTQLNLLYGNRLCWYPESEHIQYMAKIIYENKYRIDELESLQEKIRTIKNPRSYEKVVTTDTTGNDDMQINSNQSTDIDSKNLTNTVSIIDSVSESDSRAIGRNAGTTTSRLHDSMEAWDTSTEFKLDTKLKVKDKSINQKLLGIEKGVKEALVEKDLDRDEEVPQIESRAIPYNQINFTSTHDGSLYASKNSSENVTHYKQIEGILSSTNTNSNTNRVGKSVMNEKVEGEIVLKSLEVQIPNLRRKFWNLFNCLYKESCQY